MKKMWKLNNKAVSPVIATILMVAITVVLAAVLYVMVMGFGGDGGNETPTGSFTETENVNATAQKVTFGVLTPDTQIGDLKIVITLGTASDTYAWSGTAFASTTTNVATITGVAFTDLAADDKISSGDYLTLTKASASGTYTVTMLYVDSGDSIDDISFTV